MQQELIDQAGSAAGGYFKEGYNCAESVYLTFRPHLAPDLPPETMRLVSGFGGGLGQAGCLCGALASCVICLDMLKGRTSKETDRQELYGLTREFQDRFKTAFGGTCCRVLNQHPFGSRDHRVNCLRLTAGAAELLMTFLLEKELYPAQG